MKVSLPMNTETHSYSKVPVDSPSPRRVSSASVIIPAAFLCSLVVLWFQLPKFTSFPITSRYPECGHIVLMAARRHGSTWFISNAEGCISVNGSYGNLNGRSEVWNHGMVKDLTVEEAVGIVRSKTSVKIFPQALIDHREEVETFIQRIRDLQIPVFVLRRNLKKVFASLEEARRSKVWNADHGGTVVEREFHDGKRFQSFKNETVTFFDTIKTFMNDNGVKWDEIEYETILSQRVIFGENVKCYVRNCNFNW